MYSKSISNVVPGGALMLTRSLLTVEDLCQDPRGVSNDGVRDKNAGTSILAEVSEYFSGTALKLFDPLSAAFGVKSQLMDVPCVVTGHNIRIFLILTQAIKQTSKVVLEDIMN